MKGIGFASRYYSSEYLVGIPCNVVIENNKLTIVIDLKNPITWEINEIEKPVKFVNNFAQLKNNNTLLELVTPESVEIINSWYSYNNIKYKIKNSNINWHYSYVLAWFTAILILIVMFYFYCVPYLAQKFAHKIPFKYEQEIGKSSFNEILKNNTENKVCSKKLNTFFNEIAPQNAFEITIAVIKKDEVNALALPGGYIVVNDSILKCINNYNELAALLLHEYAHVHKRHTMKSVLRAASGYLLLSLITGDFTGVSALLVMGVENLNGLKYSRTLEQEADEMALDWCQNKSIDGSGLINLFKILKTTLPADALENSNEYISTHPDLENRIDYILKKKKNISIKNDKLILQLANIKASL